MWTVRLKKLSRIDRSRGRVEMKAGVRRVGEIVLPDEIVKPSRMGLRIKEKRMRSTEERSSRIFTKRVMGVGEEILSVI